MNKKLIELDYVRAISMLGVIVIHVTSSFVYAQSNLSVGGMNPAFILNQIVRFAVPMFVLLSGLSLGFSHSYTGYLPFLKSRCVKIVIPYLIWSALYWLAYHRSEGIEAFARALLQGSAASHLYFIVIMIQLYLLYPLLKRLVERRPFLWLGSAFLISIVSQGAILLAGKGVIERGPLLQNLWFLFPSWIFYFVLGMATCRLDAAKLCAWCGRHLWHLLAAAAVCAGLFSYESRLTGNLDSIKFSLFVYTPLILLAILALGYRLRERAKLNRLVSFLAAHSQTVFFSHLFVLTHLRKFPLLTTGTRGMLLLLIAETVLSVLLAWLIDTLVGLVKKRKK